MIKSDLKSFNSNIVPVQVRPGAGHFNLIKSRDKVLTITDEDIKSLAQRIAEQYLPEKIILFGSRAVGLARSDSDIDMLVIMNYEGRAFTKALEILSFLDFRKPLDLILKKPSDIQWRYEQGDPIVREALDHGVVLYEKHAR